MKEAIRTIGPLKIELRGDADAMSRLDHLKEEYAKYQDVMQRMLDRRTARSEGNVRLEQLRNPFDESDEEAESRLGEEMAIIQEHLDNTQAESIQIQSAFEGMERSAEGIAYRANQVLTAINGISDETVKINKEMKETAE